MQNRPTGTGTDLSNARNLTEGNFEKAYLEDANLSEVDAKKYRLYKRGFNRSEPFKWEFHGMRILPAAKLDNVVWKGAQVEGAKFDENVKEQILKMI